MRIRISDYLGNPLAELVTHGMDQAPLTWTGDEESMVGTIAEMTQLGFNTKAILSRMGSYSQYHEVDELGSVVKEDAGITAHGEISKIDEDKRLVFGWAYVTHDKDGQISVDKSGEFVEDYEEIEKAAYDFVIRSRAGDADHTSIKGSEMVESMVFTPEKIEKMGIPKNTIPTGWWVGFRVEDEALWKSVKDGKRMAFSIHGKGTRKQVDD